MAPPLGENEVSAWIGYGETQWGRLRLELLRAVLERHVSLPPPRVLDAGCGLAELSLRLAAAGSQVVAADASAAMLEEAERRAAGARVRWLHATVEELGAALAGERFDLVLCHNVLGYVEDPAAACSGLAALLADGGVLSLTVANRFAEPLRNALMRRDLAAALAAAERGSHRRVGDTLGVEFRLDDPETAAGWLEAAGLTIETVAGTRVVNDLLPDELKTEANRDAILALELALCERDPYSRIAPYLHLLGRQPQRRG